jgi:hypothetical protein
MHVHSLVLNLHPTSDPRVLYTQVCADHLERSAEHHAFHTQCTSAMTRGNQRETDRARAQAREAKKAKGGKSDGLTPAQRNER